MVLIRFVENEEKRTRKLKTKHLFKFNYAVAIKNKQNINNKWRFEKLKSNLL